MIAFIILAVICFGLFFVMGYIAAEAFKEGSAGFGITMVIFSLLFAGLGVISILGAADNREARCEKAGGVLVHSQCINKSAIIPIER